MFDPRLKLEFVKDVFFIELPGVTLLRMGKPYLLSRGAKAGRVCS